MINYTTFFSFPPPSPFPPPHLIPLLLFAQSGGETEILPSQSQSDRFFSLFILFILKPCLLCFYMMNTVAWTANVAQKYVKIWANAGRQARSETTLIFEHTYCHSYGHVKIFFLCWKSQQENDGNRLKEKKKMERGNHLISWLFILQSKELFGLPPTQREKGRPRIPPFSSLSVFFFHRLICPTAV